MNRRATKKLISRLQSGVTIKLLSPGWASFDDGIYYKEEKILPPKELKKLHKEWLRRQTGWRLNPGSEPEQEPEYSGPEEDDSYDPMDGERY